MENKKGRIDLIIEILSEVSKEEVSQERAKLENEGVNFASLDSRVMSLFKEETSTKPAWLKAAGEKRQRIEEVAKSIKAKIQIDTNKVAEIISDIKNGKLGSLAQQKLAAQFRNKGDGNISEQELIDILRDCDLLQLLNGDKKND